MTSSSKKIKQRERKNVKIYTPGYSKRIKHPDLRDPCFIETEEAMLHAHKEIEQIERRVRYKIETRVSSPADLIFVYLLHEPIELDQVELKAQRRYEEHSEESVIPSNWPSRPYDSYNTKLTVEETKALKQASNGTNIQEPFSKEPLTKQKTSAISKKKDNSSRQFTITAQWCDTDSSEDLTEDEDFIVHLV